MPALSAFFVTIFLFSVLIPTARAASSLERAVLFLDNIGTRLTATGQVLVQKTEKEETLDNKSEGFAEATSKSVQEGASLKKDRPEPVRYVVEEGDTISQIAQSFDISTLTVLSANDLSTRSTLQIGQELVILPIDGVEHTIVSGETLSHIAQHYKADVDEIITFNNIQDETRIRPGERLIVPGATRRNTTVSLALQTNSGYTPPPTTASARVDVNGYFSLPVSGGVITQGLHFLNAVDIGGSTYCGAPVKASAAGTVVRAESGGWNGGYGNYIKLSHANGTETIYAHNASNTVAPDQEIAQGETIGYMGSTGNTTGCHVHFAVRGASNPFSQ